MIIDEISKSILKNAFWESVFKIERWNIGSSLTYRYLSNLITQGLLHNEVHMYKSTQKIIGSNLWESRGKLYHWMMYFLTHFLITEIFLPWFYFSTMEEYSCRKNKLFSFGKHLGGQSWQDFVVVFFNRGNVVELYCFLVKFEIYFVLYFLCPIQRSYWQQ